MTPGQSDTYLRCLTCGRTSTTSFSLSRGWEKCCGYTMQLVRTEADIETAVAQAAGPGASFLRDLARGEATDR